MIVRLEAQAERLARRLRHQKVGTGVLSGWARRQDERRLEELRARLEAEREAVFGRPVPPKPHHRVADHDREETVTALSRAHREGRLDAAELEQRIGDAYAASTYAELEALVADIGALRAASGQKRRVSDPEREGAVRVLRAVLEEGRLSPDEFSARAERAYAARVRRRDRRSGRRPARLLRPAGSSSSRRPANDGDLVAASCPPRSGSPPTG